jgi:uncharacterized membrane protein YedE/YeeE
MDLATATDFTPLSSLIGGVLIGLSAVMVMALFGRIAGISGISQAVLARLMQPATATSDTGWRLAFLAGLVAAPFIYVIGTGRLPEQAVPTSTIGMAIAGLLVGIGTTWGSGCTSGHGVCGLARLSVRSLAAVLMFMATAGLTVFILRHMI